MRITTSASLTAIAVALAGCSGNKHDGPTAGNTMAPDAQVAATKIDVCKLLSAYDVLAITGDKLIGTEQSDTDGCNYKTSDQESLKIQVDPTGGKDQMALARKSGQLIGDIGTAVSSTSDVGPDVNATLSKGKTPAPAIGDEAIWEANAMLAVRKGDAFVQVTAPVAHDPAKHKGIPLIVDAERRKMAQDTAVKLLAKLGA